MAKLELLYEGTGVKIFVELIDERSAEGWRVVEETTTSRRSTVCGTVGQTLRTWTGWVRWYAGD